MFSTSVPGLGGTRHRPSFQSNCSSRSTHPRCSSRYLPVQTVLPQQQCHLGPAGMWSMHQEQYSSTAAQYSRLPAVSSITSSCMWASNPAAPSSYTAMSSSAKPCRIQAALQHKHRQQQGRKAAPAAATSSATLRGSESQAASIPSNPPVGPQRAATQKIAAAAPAAAAAVSTALAVQQVSSRQQQQQQDGSPQAHVWLPDKQLWVPHSSAAVARPSNPLSSGISHGPSLARVFMASAATQGRKKAMEDRHVLAALDPKHGVTAAHGAVTTQQAVSVAAVFDGHAGEATANYAAQHIPHLVHSALSGRSVAARGGPVSHTRELLCPASAVAASFQWFDRWWADARCDPAFTQHGWDESGSTAVVGLVSGQQLTVANAGDSIALLAHQGRSRRLTEEHRLDNEAEAERVREAGGRVVRLRPGAAPRVVGTSNQTRFKGSMVTRSLGDFAFKSPQALLSAEPFVSTHQLDPADRLVLFTSDGVSDVLPDDDLLGIGLRAIEEAQSSTNHGPSLAKAAANAVMHAAFQSGSNDNITVVAMLLDWGYEFDDNDA